jgi:hypothetical protein
MGVEPAFLGGVGRDAWHKQHDHGHQHQTDPRHRLSFPEGTNAADYAGTAAKG